MDKSFNNFHIYFVIYSKIIDLKIYCRYFTIAPELSRISSAFATKFNIGETSRNKHHEDIGSKKNRMQTNKSNLVKVFTDYGFLENTGEELQNIFTRKKIESSIAFDVVNRDSLGQEMCDKFVNERLIEGNRAIWEPLTRSKVKTFTSVPSSKNTIEPPLIEERKLLHDLLIVVRRRPELDLEKCISEYEFSSVPRSLFSNAGEIFLANDKSKIVKTMEGLAENIRVKELCFNSKSNIIIIDGMALVHSIKKDKTIKTCLDLAKVFNKMLCSATKNFDKVYLIFDRYIPTSLKEATRNKRKGKKSSRYFIKANTKIENVTLSDLLADEETKRELVTFLAENTLDWWQRQDTKNIFVTADGQTKNNFDNIVATNSHEEADTLVILHGSTLPPDCQLVVSSSDTDVLLLLVYFHNLLPKNTFVFSGKGSAKKYLCVESLAKSLGEEKTKAMLGFHAFTGKFTYLKYIMYYLIKNVN
jgi:hypothetical protein